MPLNHYAINSIIQGKMVPAGRAVRFGPSGVTGVTATMLKHRPKPNVKFDFDRDADKKLFDAFIQVHAGASAETIMIDKALASRFHAAARKRGVHASAADLNRRLLNFRKNPSRFRQYGIVLPEASNVKPHESIVPEYAHVVEFSLSRLHSRYGASIDDILIDPALADEYEKMAQSAAPELTSLQLRLAALYIRKTRYIAKASEKLIESLSTAEMESAFLDLGTLQGLKIPDQVHGEGLVEVLENDRHLYISHNEDLPAAITKIGSDATLKFMANDFWRPRRERLVVRAFASPEFLKVPVSQWQLKLIQEKRPVFNWPVAA